MKTTINLSSQALNLPTFQRNCAGIALTIIVGALAIPTLAVAAPSRNATAHFQRGLELSLASNWKGAEKEFRMAVQLDPQNPAYRSHLADALAAQGQFEKAGQAVKQEKQLKKMGYQPTTLVPTKRKSQPVVVKLPSKFTSQTPSKFTAQSASEQVTSPITELPVDEKRPPASFSAVDRLGPLNLPTYMFEATPGKGGDTMVVQENPSIIHPALEKASALFDESKWREAEAEYRRALAHYPRLDEGWNSVGDCCLKQSQWNEAVQAFRQAVRLRPDESYYHAQLAEALLKWDRKDEAIKEAREAIRLGLEDHPVFDDLGLTGQAAG